MKKSKKWLNWWLFDQWPNLSLSVLLWFSFFPHISQSSFLNALILPLLAVNHSLYSFKKYYKDYYTIYTCIIASFPASSNYESVLDCVDLKMWLLATVCMPFIFFVLFPHVPYTHKCSNHFLCQCHSKSMSHIWFSIEDATAICQHEPFPACIGPVKA